MKILFNFIFNYPGPENDCNHTLQKLIVEYQAKNCFYNATT